MGGLDYARLGAAARLWSLLALARQCLGRLLVENFRFGCGKFIEGGHWSTGLSVEPAGGWCGVYWRDSGSTRGYPVESTGGIKYIQKN